MSSAAGAGVVLLASSGVWTTVDCAVWTVQCFRPSYGETSPERVFQMLLTQGVNNAYLRMVVGIL